MERMDEQILPALYNFIGHSFQATPSQLGTLTLCRAMVQALSSPIGGLSGNVPLQRSQHIYVLSSCPETILPALQVITTIASM